MILEIQSGLVAPRSMEIEAGSEVRVGRAAPAQIIVNDQTVSRLHFAIAFDGRSCRLRDLESTHGTLVNETRTTEAVLHDGDRIRAGMTNFRVRFADESPKGPGIPVVAAPLDRAGPALVTAPGTSDMPVLEPDLHDLVIQELRSQREPLYAILDAARDPLILARLLDCKEEHQSLYEGIEGQKLVAFAPYLVAMPRGSKFLDTIVRDGWGKSWGVYLTCDLPFKEVRKHLRQFLMVQVEGGKQVYFRYYDPRVLRLFLPTCTNHEASQFFGPIRHYLFEGADPAQIRVGSAEGGLRRVQNRALITIRPVESAAVL